MREIKFRAWDGKKMYMPHELIQDECGISTGYYDESGCPKGDSDILQQYAGLRDKNGKEIYEGDILKLRRHNAVVEFGEYRAGGLDYYSKDAYGFYLKPLVCGEEQYDTETLCEKEYAIIGNIYENPELVESISKEVAE